MALPVDATFAQVRIVGRIHGSITNNVLHFAVSTGSLTDPLIRDLLLALANAVLDCILETLLPAVTQDWQCLRVEAKLMNPVTDPQFATPETDQFGELGPASVSFASSLINVRTGVGGRRGRGRMFLPPPGEAQTANSVMDAPTQELLVAFLVCIANKFIGGSRTEGPQLALWSRKDSQAAAGSLSAGMREVVQLTPNPTIAVMRSRKLGIGA